jgi:hypothetical protein
MRCQGLSGDCPVSSVEKLSGSKEPEAAALAGSLVSVLRRARTSPSTAELRVVSRPENCGWAMAAS